MKKILLALTLIGVLVFPMAGLAQTRIEQCTLTHDLGKAMCNEYDNPENKLQKGCIVTAGTTVDSGCIPDCPSGTSVEPRDGATICLIDFMSTISDWVFAIFLVLAVMMLVFAGIEFVTAGGSPEKVTSARTKIIYAIVGIAIAFLAKGLVRVIEALVAG